MRPGLASLREHISHLEIERYRELEEAKRRGARENTRGADMLRGPLLPRPARPRPVCRHWGRRGVTACYCREDVVRSGEGSGGGGGAGRGVSERWGFVWAWGMLTFGTVLQHRFLSPLADTWT